MDEHLLASEQGLRGYEYAVLVGIRTACELPFLNSLVLVKSDLFRFMIRYTFTPKIKGRMAGFVKSVGLID